MEVEIRLRMCNNSLIEFISIENGISLKHYLILSKMNRKHNETMFIFVEFCEENIKVFLNWFYIEFSLVKILIVVEITNVSDNHLEKSGKRFFANII